MTTSGGRIKELDLDISGLKWAIQLPNPITAPPSINNDENSIYTLTDSESGSAVLNKLQLEDGSGLWRQRLEHSVIGSPVTRDGRVFLVADGSLGSSTSTNNSGSRSRIVSYNTTGEQLWQTPPRGGAVRILGRKENSLFAGTSDDYLESRGEKLFAISTNGDIQWEVPAGDVMGGVIRKDMIIYNSGTSRIVSHNLDGSKKWAVPGMALGTSSYDIKTTNELWFSRISSGRPQLVAYSFSGKEEWRYPVESQSDLADPTGVSVSPPSLHPERSEPVVVGAGFNGTIFALSSDGRELWTNKISQRTRGDPNGPVVGNLVYVGDDGGIVHALDPTNGDELWKDKLSGNPQLLPTSDGVLAYVYEEGSYTIQRYRNDGSKLWRYETNKEVTKPLISENQVQIGGKDGVLLSFKL